MKTSLRHLLPVLASFGIAFVSAQQLHASIAYDITNTTGPQLGSGAFVLGFQFTVNDTISVEQLGVFDAGSDGLVKSRTIGVFSQAGSLLASAMVGSGTSAALDDGFRYVSLSVPLLLTSAGGTYSIGTVYEALDGDGLIFQTTPATGFSANSSINFVGASSATGNSLIAPSTLDGGVAYFGPNFQFSVPDTSGTPEPASLAIWGLGALGLAAVGRARRRKA
jgi:MYXO-CTERM domain-containing protein